MPAQRTRATDMYDSDFSISEESETPPIVFTIQHYLGEDDAVTIDAQAESTDGVRQHLSMIVDWKPDGENATLCMSLYLASDLYVWDDKARKHLSLPISLVDKVLSLYNHLFSQAQITQMTVKIHHPTASRASWLGNPRVSEVNWLELFQYIDDRPEFKATRCTWKFEVTTSDIDENKSTETFYRDGGIFTAEMDIAAEHIDLLDKLNHLRDSRARPVRLTKLHISPPSPTLPSSVVDKLRKQFISNNVLGRQYFIKCLTIPHAFCRNFEPFDFLPVLVMDDLGYLDLGGNYDAWETVQREHGRPYRRNFVQYE